jgi:tRNA (guanine37-N1)-methyltransferase
MARVYDDPFPAYVSPKSSKTQEEKERKRLRSQSGGNRFRYPETSSTNDITLVMNLPESAITFLDAFRGLLVDDGSRDLAGVYLQMPMIHCHCFTRELEFKSAERDIRRVRISVACLVIAAADASY